MNCIIIDDEPLALAKLEGYVKAIPYLHLVKSCQDAGEAMEVLSETNIDLIFSDINMPDLSGIDFANSLTGSPMLIFTTAYPQYAIDGFRLNAIDFLLKPFDFNDCQRAAEKARKIYEYRQARNLPKDEEEKSSLFVRSEYKVIRVEVENIKYIEGMSEYIRIYTTDRDKPISTLNSLQKLEERLPDYFLRVHRSYIVNMRRVSEISRYRILFGKETIIPVGDIYKERFTSYLNKNGLI